MTQIGDHIGPYVLRRQLVVSDGVELWTADSSSGDSVYVQLIRLDHRSCNYDSRLPTDASDDDPEESSPSEGQLRLRSIAKETAKLLSKSAAPKVQAHGSTSREDGHRLVYWGFELDDDINDVEARVEPEFSSYSQWSTAFLHSLDELKTSHDSDYTFGHLRQHWLQCEPENSAAVKFLGLYVPVAQEWLFPETVWHEPAPFETDGSTKRGDLWRIGKIFSSTLPAKRTSDAETLIAEYLEMLNSADDSQKFLSLWRQRLDESLVALEDEAFSEQTRQKPTREERMRDPVLSATPVSEITDEESSTGSSSRSLSEALTQQATFAEVPTVPPEVEALDIPDEAPEEAQPDAESPGQAESLDVPDEAPDAESPGEVASEEESLDVPDEAPDVESLEVPEEAPMDPEAAAWASPELPAGASPWSEIVSAAEVPKRKHSAADFPGFDDELPTSAPGDEVEHPSPVTFERIDDYEPQNTELSEPEDEAFEKVVSGFNVEKTVVGLVLLTAIFALFFGLFRSETDVSATTTVRSLNYWAVSELNEVVVDSVISGAQIVSKEDGLILGSTPQKFLSPGGSRSSLFLLAPGYEAQSLLLPDRGTLDVGLNKLPQDAECTVRLSSLTNTPFRAVGENIGSPPNFRINGTAVVSATQEDGPVGARLVRCPRLGGSSVQSLKFNPMRTSSVLHVTSPVGVTLYVDGIEKGKIPQKIESKGSFVRLTIEMNDQSKSWWVPMAEGAEVQLPASEASNRPGE